MKNKPRILTYLSVFLVAVAISLPIQIMLLYGNTPAEVHAIAAKLAPLNWLILVAAPLTAWLVYRASPWVIVSAPILMALVTWNNWLVAEIGNDYPVMAVGFGTGFFLLAMGALLTRDARELLMNPDRRWWMTPMRKRVNLEASLQPTDSKMEYYASAFDISETGAFLTNTSLAGLNPGSHCKLRIVLDQGHDIECDAEIMRVTRPVGHYPQGVGVRFVDLGFNEKKFLHRFTDRENQMAAAA